MHGNFAEFEFITDGIGYLLPQKIIIPGPTQAPGSRPVLPTQAQALVPVPESPEVLPQESASLISAQTKNMKAMN